MSRQLSVAVPIVIIVVLFMVIGVFLPVTPSQAATQSALPAQSSVQAVISNTIPNEGVFPGAPQASVSSKSPQSVSGDPIEGDPLERDAEFYAKRAAHDPAVDFTLAEAAALRAQAADQLSVVLQNRPEQPVQGESYSGV